MTLQFMSISFELLVNELISTVYKILLKHKIEILCHYQIPAYTFFVRASNVTLKFIHSSESLENTEWKSTLSSNIIASCWQIHDRKKKFHAIKVNKFVKV